jgi:octaheme c-type cytochrome (tetrathionate reductase family)
MKRILVALFVLVGAGALIVLALRRNEVEQPTSQILREKYGRKFVASVDHSKFTQLQKPFKRPQDVTLECIGCHNGRAAEVMKSSHWLWEREEFIPGHGIRAVGKKNILNNFCIGTSGSHQSCNKCHIGYGWGDNEDFSFDKPENVDCLACHDNSNTYVKGSGKAGYPDSSVDLNKVARNVGLPMRANCGTCHFFGGGGNNVKHGDLEKSLFEPLRTIDVHMGTDGADMQCIACHSAEKHQMKGKSYSLSSMNRNRTECETCHTAIPHKDDILNRHTYKVACQTCHIPRYAKVNKTKVYWDWSTAGKLNNGEPYEEKDSTGYDSYLSIKGSFVWGNNLKPEYIWSNGTAGHYLLGDTARTQPVMLNDLRGSYDDPDAKIIPVKIMRGKQPYDPVNGTIIQPKLFAAQKGEGGFWQDFNWESASREGMKLVGLPFSGKTEFIETEMVWPVNHMVSPKTETVKCNECHTREDSRLAKLTDFYLPGRDRSASIDGIGGAVIGLSLVGVAVHAGFRIILSRRNRKEARIS